jgi:kynurenine formamidase
MTTLIDLAAGARLYDLAQPLEAGTPTSGNHPPFRMALQRRHGDVVRHDGASAASEMFVMGGHTGTHIDALCHVSYQGRLHGGIDAADAARGGRFRELGVETIAPMVCRGVLLDVPAALGTDQLGPAFAITAELLEDCCRRQEVEVRAGDAVLIRSGWHVGRWTDARAFQGEASGVPGPDESGARWLSTQGIRVTGADTIAYEWLAPGAGHALLPVHTHLLVEAGIHIVEVMNLELLAADHISEFMFVLAPLRIVGATGSPVRPLALVE